MTQEKSIEFFSLLGRQIQPLIDALRIDVRNPFEVSECLQTKSNELGRKAFMEAFKDVGFEGVVPINLTPLLAVKPPKLGPVRVS